ncbi:MAG: hypothetical protein Q8R24_08860 [Legionellaceae bacterium]|nr:hypothetical protein [Legionellaceae bacterium]
MNPIYFGVCVWSRAYCELFVNYALASLLADENIPALDNSSKKNCFLLSTTKEDWQWFQSQPLFKLLQCHMDVELLEITLISEEEYQKLNNRLGLSKLYTMTLGHRQILNKMHADKAVGSIVFPDSIYSKNAISSAYKHIANGKTSVLVHCPRFSTTSIVDELRDMQYVKPGVPLTIEPRTLVQVAIQHLHIDMRMQQWEAPYAPEFFMDPSWVLPNNSGMLFYTWSCWYAFIDYAKMPSHNINSLQDNTIDGAYFDNNLKKNEAHFITDSDEFTLITFSPHMYRTIRQHSISNHFDQKAINLTKIDFARRKIKETMGANLSVFKSQFANKPVYWHTKDLTPSCFKLQECTMNLIKKIMSSKLSLVDKITLKMNRTYHSIQTEEIKINTFQPSFPKPAMTFKPFSHYAYSIFNGLKKLMRRLFVWGKILLIGFFFGATLTLFIVLLRVWGFY